MGKHSDNEPSTAILSQLQTLSDFPTSDWLSGSKSHLADSHFEGPDWWKKKKQVMKNQDKNVPPAHFFLNLDESLFI